MRELAIAGGRAPRGAAGRAHPEGLEGARDTQRPDQRSAAAQEGAPGVACAPSLGSASGQGWSPSGVGQVEEMEASPRTGVKVVKSLRCARDAALCPRVP